MKINGSLQEIAAYFVGQGFRTLASTVRQLILVALLAAACSVQASEQDPAFSSHATDMAQVLGVGAVNLDSKLAAFETSTGYQVFVLTVRTTGNRSIEEYAVDMFQKWKVGQARIDNGVLFVIAVDDRQMRIEVGYGLEGTLTDAICSRIVHDVVAPHFAKGQYEAGVDAGVDAILLALSPSPAGQSSASALPNEPAQRVSTPGQGQNAGLAFVGVMLAGIAIGTLWFGLAGLFPFVIFGSALANLAFPKMPGRLLVLALTSAWLCGRWLLIAKNVREHHLPGSTNRVVTWIFVFFFTRGSGRPLAPGERRFFRSSVSFTSSDRGKSSAADEPASGGHGGRSGGAGASGRW